MPKWMWGVVALAVIGLAVWQLRTVPVDEVLELAADGGERALRDPMRPVRGGMRVLIFALDGVGDDEFHAATASGAMPKVAALLGADTAAGRYGHAYAVRGALSILPSTTMAAWASIFSGEPAGRTGVPGNEWFVRSEMRYLAPAPVSVEGHEHTGEMLSDGLVGNAIRVPTLFERADVRAFVSLAPVYRGADLFTTPPPSALTDIFAAITKGVTGEQSVEREAYSELDFTSVEELLAAIETHGVPDLQVVYFPGIDLFTHVADAPLLEEVAYLTTVTDSAIGRVLARYDSLGVLDSTYVVFISDHGHTPVLNDDRHALGSDGDDEPPAVLAHAGFRVRPFVLEPGDDEQDYQATVAYQGAMAYVYLADRSGCPDPGDRCDWRRPPRLEQDVMPVVRAFHSASESGSPVPALRGTLDLVLAREPAAPGAESGPFQIFDGERLVPIGEYLERNPRPDLVQFEERMRALAEGPFGDRAGDALLLARAGAHRPIEDRFYFSGPYHSWHGSAGAQDGEIPFVIARRGVTAAALAALVEPHLSPAPSQLDFIGVVLALLGRTGPTAR